MVVNTKTIIKILRLIEAYYISKNNFVLDGSNYDLTLLIPSESTGIIKYSWIISAKKFDTESETKIVNSLFEKISKNLTIEEYSSIARINVINSEDPLVKNINFVIPSVSQDIVVLNGINIGHYDLNGSVLIRSSILGGIRAGRNAIITLNVGKTFNANIISIDESFKIKYYTEKGIKAILKPDGFDRAKAQGLKTKGETFLMNNSYIATVYLTDIKDIV